MLTLQNPVTQETTTVYTHLVTLINRRTNQEVALHVETLSERFVDVMHQICWMKVDRGLQGYEVFEVLPLDAPAPF